MKKMLGVKRVLTVALYSTDLALFPGSPRARTRSGKERGELVSCPPPPPPPPRARLLARNGLVKEVKFLGLIPQNGERPMRLRER